MIEKDVDKIDESDLQLLKDNRVSEGKTIEYKQSLPSNSREDKIKFLSGISSFANASGGDYIIGIVEDKGLPKKIEGVEIDDSDKEKLRLEQIIRDGISPRMPFITVKTIKLRNGKTVFIIRASPSWIKPHRVIFIGHDNFYSRNSAGKYPLDVDELRIAFNLTETTKDKIMDFRTDRISKIFSNETPIPLIKGAKVALHLIPLSSFSSLKDHELNKYFSSNQYPESLFPRSNLVSWRFNIDGFLAYMPTHDGRLNTYAQIFRNGIIEYVNKIEYVEYLYEGSSDKIGENKIYSENFQREIIECTSQYLILLNKISAGLPIFLFMALLGVKDFSLVVDNKYKLFSPRRVHKIDRNIFTFPGISIEDHEVNEARILKPWFDLLWNACGHEKCFHYDDNGDYMPRT